MEKHEQHLAITTEKFESVDKRVDVDLQAVISDLKLQADDIGDRLFNVQKEQIKPMKELADEQANEI